MRHLMAWSVLWAILPAGIASAADEPYPEWTRKKLTVMATTQPGLQGAPAREEMSRRIAARDEIIRSVSDEALDLSVKMERCRELGRALVPVIGSADSFVSLSGAMIAAKARHVWMVQVLTTGLSSPQAQVRYWCARGLRDIQVGMFLQGGQQFFNAPINALQAACLAEQTVCVRQEMIRALGFADPDGKIANAAGAPVAMAIKYRAFLAVLGPQIKCVGDCDLDSLPAVLSALDSANEWAAADKSMLADVVRHEAQVLRWASQLYDRAFASLTDEQKGKLEQVMLRAAENMAAQVDKTEIFTRLNDALRNGDRIAVQKEVLVAVGGKGMKDWTIKPICPAPPTDLPAPKP